MDQNRELPDFKGRPEYILPSLKIFKDYEGDWKAIWTHLVKIAREKGSDAKDDNIVSAYITPMLRNLKLIEGDGENTKLSPDGKQCLRLFNQNGEYVYKKRLGYQIIKVDEENANLLSYLLKNHNSRTTAVSAAKLKENLSSMGIKGADKETRVPGWLSLLEFVELVRNINSCYYVLRSQFDVFKKGEKEPSLQEFTEALRDSSRRLKYITKGSPYIPIPDFREDVCEKVGISSFTFDKLIRKFPPNYHGVRLVFATPMRQKRGGITLRGKYYYFIGVFT